MPEPLRLIGDSMKDILKKLASVSDFLDEKGFEHLADKVDKVFVKLAQPIVVQNIKDELSQVFKQNLVIETSNRPTATGLVPIYSVNVLDNGMLFEAAFDPITERSTWTIRIDKEQAPPVTLINKAVEIFKRRNIDYGVEYKEPDLEYGNN